LGDILPQRPDLNFYYRFPGNRKRAWLLGFTHMVLEKKGGRPFGAMDFVNAGFIKLFERGKFYPRGGCKLFCGKKF